MDRDGSLRYGLSGTGGPSLLFAVQSVTFYIKGFLDFTTWPGADTRNLNRRGSTLWRPLVSVDLRTDEMSSTGGHRFFAPFFTENEHTGSFSGRFEPRAPRASGLQVAFTFSKCHTVVPLPSLPSTMLGMTTRMVVSFRLEQTQ